VLGVLSGDVGTEVVEVSDVTSEDADKVLTGEDDVSVESV